MRGRLRVVSFGERRREALVEELDGNREPRPQRLDEPLRLAGLLAAFPLEGERQSDDHRLRPLVDDDLGDPRQPRLGSPHLPRP